MNGKKEQLSNFAILFVLIQSVLTGVHWTILAFGIPVLDNLPYWKYKLLFTPIETVWIFFALIALSLAIFVVYSHFSQALKLVLLILLGTFIQYSFAFSKGQGLDGLRDRMVNAGHAEFAKAAVEQPGDILWVLQNYEEVAAKKKYGYIGSKPPGTFLFYLIFEQSAHFFFPPTTNRIERLQNLRTFASWTWPLISYLVVVPLYLLSREFLKDPKLALMTCILYISIPSVTLITLHTDQVIYPLLAVSVVQLGFVTYRLENIWLAFLCGALLYFAMYFSFGLAIMGTFFILPVMISLFDGVNFTIWRAIKYWVLILLGAIFLHIMVAYFFEYDIATRYSNAWENHLNWKSWENTLETYISSGITNIIEFSVWIGMPVTVMFLLSLFRSFREILTRKIEASAFLNLTLFGIFIFLLAFGKTKAETARLWLFLVPFICISISSYIDLQAWSQRNKSVFIIIVLLLEIGTTFFTVHFQDFS